jgi:hypothetical protein
VSKEYDFSGIWRSDFYFKSSTRPGQFEKIDYVRLHLLGNQLVLESVPAEDGSYMIARFSLDGRIATGSWQDYMGDDTYYNGRVYHGATQLVLEEDGNALTGKWVGFGENMIVNSGDWQIVRTNKKGPIKKVSTIKTVPKH